jgi:hypothetical protein
MPRGKDQIAPSVSFGGIMMENKKGDGGPRNQGRITQAEKIEDRKGGQEK